MDDAEHQWSLPVDDAVDEQETGIDNNRVEALGVRRTLKRIYDAKDEIFACEDEAERAQESHLAVGVDSKSITKITRAGLGQHRGPNADIMESIYAEVRRLNEEGIRALAESECPRDSVGIHTNWVVATDSQYGIQRMTSTLVRADKHEDVLEKIKSELQKLKKKGSRVDFWHIGRVQNRAADLLARDAAKKSLEKK
ncbi:hypothetical protein CONPUDRAFT_152612 [Coniophora puteana RWD-64-598 SS2]|uniref:Uncharacterized protein n=1 Tax=Coniophora puteana (strain RWD-64-598) TaxID=741705 RepID=A0A5M3MSH2_CONPW|nr:uncharacterized protein CONPUDRAFT_152612 [Coniophora puteana RWD-64-598 SS2]EIW81694.1 hypothetical protein CONPUDRAFT_152612 [Coniophora puteana RWD-64-598 SS2]